jgi:hypothetical protein
MWTISQFCREEDYARPLTEDELAERDTLLSENPFKDWMRRDFNAFIRACEKHGRSNIDAIAKEVDSKSEEEVRTCCAQQSNIFRPTQFVLGFARTQLPVCPRVCATRRSLLLL